MRLIQAFLAAHMGFLWHGARFRIVGSQVTTSNGGDALLLVESDRVRLRFLCDRRQLMLELQPSHAAPSEAWYSIDLVRRLFLGRREASALLDESYAAFLEKHLDEVEDRFSSERWISTRVELEALRAQRAKEMFGRGVTLRAARPRRRPEPTARTGWPPARAPPSRRTRRTPARR